MSMRTVPDLTKWLRGIRRARLRSRFATGLVFLAVVALVGLALGYKPAIQSFFRSGHTITAEFKRNYHIYPDETRVQMSGLEVGVVSDVEPTERGTTLVSMKIQDSAVESLGAQPSARVKPNTLLGGNYAIELSRGGHPGPFRGETIPRERTATPEELDRILEALPHPTRKSLQNIVRRLDATLTKGGSVTVRALLKRAPSTLRPAGNVLEAAQGSRPGVDLPRLVTNLNSVAHVLTRRSGQLSAIVSGLHSTTGVLAKRSQPLADGIETMPATLESARTGMIDLRGTLGRLTDTAESIRPTARAVDPLLRRLDPVLSNALPLMRDLRALMVDAQPVVRQLVPLTQRGTQTLEPIEGPVLDRVNGPIAHTVLNTWRGSGPYKHSGGGMQAEHKFYQELGYLASNLDRASMTQDEQGSLLGFQVGFNTRSVVGTPLTFPQLLEQLRKAGGAR